MKKYFENGRFGMLVSLMLMVLSVVAGGGVMMAEGIVIPNDPVDADKNDLASPDGLGAGQDLTGTVASGTQARIGDIVEDEWDKEVAHYQEKKFPLDTMIRLRAKQRKATGYEVGHFREGSTVLDMVVKGNIGDGTKTSIDLTSSNVSGDISTFAAHRLIAVNGVSGYVDGSSTEEEGTLILFVKSNDGDKATCIALNGKSTEVGGPTTCPVIPDGTKLSALSNACYESQLVVAPSNFQPRPKVAFLQKHIFNYVITDHYKELMKKTPHAEKEIRDAAMYDFRRQRERNSLIGTQRKFLFNVPNMGKQYIYTSNGVLPQLINKFGVDEWDYATLIAISKMQFTDFSENSEADFFMGKNLLEKVQNIDFTKHKDIEYKGETVAGIEIVAFKSIFGKLNFIHCPQLDDLGMSDYGFICDLKNAVRYVKEAGKEDTKSMDDGSENAQEAERTRHIEIDAICLKGYNSMLVGPVDGIDNVKYTKSATNVTMMEALPENPTEGQKVFLTSTDGTYEGGHVYTYNGTKWDLAKS
jgi:hypothetical protein